MRAWMVLFLVLLAGCVATEGEERIPAPTSTWTQEAGVTVEEIQLGADGLYSIPDRGDGCAYTERGREDATPFSPAVVALWSDGPGCELGFFFEPATGEVRLVAP